jgi:hypothetical protein
MQIMQWKMEFLLRFLCSTDLHKLMKFFLWFFENCYSGIFEKTSKNYAAGMVKNGHFYFQKFLWLTRVQVFRGFLTNYAAMMVTNGHCWFRWQTVDNDCMMHFYGWMAVYIFADFTPVMLRQKCPFSFRVFREKCPKSFNQKL